MSDLKYVRYQIFWCIVLVGLYRHADVDYVQPVAMRSAAFCYVCIFLMLVVDTIEANMVEAYSNIDPATALFKIEVGSNTLGSASLVLYSAGSRVTSVYVVLSELSMKFFFI